MLYDLMFFSNYLLFKNTANERFDTLQSAGARYGNAKSGDPVVLETIHPLQVLQGNGLLALPASSLDAAHASVGTRVQQHDAGERRAVLLYVVEPLFVQAELDGVELAIVFQHLGKDMVVCVHASLSDVHVATREQGFVVCDSFFNKLMSTENCTVLESEGPPVLVVIVDLPVI